MRCLVCPVQAHCTTWSEYPKDISLDTTGFLKQKQNFILKKFIGNSVETFNFFFFTQTFYMFMLYVAFFIYFIRIQQKK